MSDKFLLTNKRFHRQDQKRSYLILNVQLKTFFNTYIRSATKIVNAKALNNNFEIFFRDRLKKEIDNKKQENTKQKYREILEET